MARGPVLIGKKHEVNDANETGGDAAKSDSGTLLMDLLDVDVVDCAAGSEVQTVLRVQLMRLRYLGLGHDSDHRGVGRTGIRTVQGRRDRGGLDEPAKMGAPSVRTGLERAESPPRLLDPPFLGRYGRDRIERSLLWAFPERESSGCSREQLGPRCNESIGSVAVMP